jgi:protease I
MKKILFIIAQQNFRDEELKIPKQILEEKAKVTTASITTQEARGMLGLKVKPEISVRDSNPNDFDLLVVVGGSGSPKLADYPEVLNLIKKFYEQKKPIAAICLAPYVLAKAGILRGKKVTCYPADFALSELRRTGATYISKPVVVDGDLVTAVGPEAAKEFGEQIVKML